MGAVRRKDLNQKWSSQLGLLEGRGGLTVTRDEDGAVVGGRGWWHSTEGDLLPEDIAAIFKPGGAVTFEGPIYDGVDDEPVVEQVVVEVEITRVECASHSEGDASEATRVDFIPVKVSG